MSSRLLRRHINQPTNPPNDQLVLSRRREKRERGGLWFTGGPSLRTELCSISDTHGASSGQEPWTSTSGGRLDVDKWLRETARDVTVHLNTGGHICSRSPSTLQVVQNNLLLFFFCLCLFWKFVMAQSTWYTSALIRNTSFKWRPQSWKQPK